MQASLSTVKRRGTLALAVLLGVAFGGAVRGKVMGPPPVPDQVATADLIFVGKVTAIEDKTVMAKRFPDDAERTEFRIALVQIAEPLKGTKGLTTVRLGFVPPVPQPGRGGVGPSGIRFPQLNHTVGQEACFFLTKVPDGDFHVATMYFNVIEKKSPTFGEEIARIRRVAKLMDDPLAGLKSKDADDRLMTASMLLTKYRTPKAGQANPKQEPVAAEESKLILEAIAGGDWNRQDRQAVSPRMVLARLNLSPQDGWNPPKFTDFQKEYPAYAQQWLKENAGKYRVQRFVP